MIERTFSILKPCVVKKNQIGKINSMLERVGLKIVAQKMIKISNEQAKDFYIDHIAQPFFDSLIKYMISGPVVVQVLKGDNAVSINRKVMGATNPQNADSGTIRKLFGANIEMNAIHGSDSLNSAKREIDMFFKKDEIME